MSFLRDLTVLRSADESNHARLMAVFNILTGTVVDAAGNVRPQAGGIGTGGALGGGGTLGGTGTPPASSQTDVNLNIPDQQTGLVLNSGMINNVFRFPSVMPQLVFRSRNQFYRVDTLITQYRNLAGSPVGINASIDLINCAIACITTTSGLFQHINRSVPGAALDTITDATLFRYTHIGVQTTVADFLFVLTSRGGRALSRDYGNVASVFVALEQAMNANIQIFNGLRVTRYEHIPNAGPTAVVTGKDIAGTENGANTAEMYRGVVGEYLTRLSMFVNHVNMVV